ncbi:hypothetical protein HZH68_010950 [Vespula germanica]|uniref:Uncharacterized protein n=1 Tax=Vespula germanica TaxID=30212 RepID=A0A834JTH0_VESGE|nr:hypothetical protein HZH68_010950 [Vespula germanica]
MAEHDRGGSSVSRGTQSRGRRRVVMKEKKELQQQQQQHRRLLVGPFLGIEIPRRLRRRFIEKSREEPMKAERSRVKVLQSCRSCFYVYTFLRITRGTTYVLRDGVGCGGDSCGSDSCGSDGVAGVTMGKDQGSPRIYFSSPVVYINNHICLLFSSKLFGSSKEEEVEEEEEEKEKEKEEEERRRGGEEVEEEGKDYTNRK